jgi:hypothetical protein
MNGYPQAPASHSFTLRDLPLAARLTLAVFLISVGIGYVSALVQLHFQHASPGELLPTPDDAVRVFFGQTGEKPKSKIEKLLPEADQGPFNGSGQMTSAFTKRSEDLKKAISDRAKTLAKKARANPKDPAMQEAAEAEVRKERDTERRCLLAWIQAGANEKEYNDDAFPLPAELANRSMTSNYLVSEDDKVVEPHAAKIKTLLQDRCVRCHSPEGEDAQAIQFPLDSYAHLKPYITVQTSSGMSLTKLAQTTHVHLLGFSMLYGLTGLILAFSSYPRILRIVLCPLPLLAQVADISFWWLARLPEPHGPMFARAIVISGAVVAVGLLLHIVLSVFNLFSKKTWLLLLLLFAAAGYGGYVVKERVIDPFIAQETAPTKAE